MPLKRPVPHRIRLRSRLVARLFGLLIVPILISTTKAPQPAVANDGSPTDAGPKASTPATAPHKTAPTNGKTKSASNAHWHAFGRVTDANGQPLAGVEVRANCGMGTAPCTGTATSGADGRYDLDFGPGIFTTDKEPFVQAAFIHARKDGYVERNLSRQGNCIAANAPPDKSQRDDWNGENRRLFLPEQPLELNFVMQPAARVAGELVGEQGQPMAGYSVSLTGPDLPPASSVLSSVKTDEHGTFRLEEIPTNFRFQFVVRESHPKPPWNDSWASAPLTFKLSDKANLAAHIGNREIRLEKLRLRVMGPGVHERRATRVAGNLGVLNLTVDNLGEIVEQTPTKLAAKSATLTLTNSSRDMQKAFLIPESAPSDPSAHSKTRLQRTRPNDKGEFVISFENPPGFDLTRDKHQVIFQVFTPASGATKPKRFLRQLEIRDGRYEIPVKVSPELIVNSRVSITFVTIQPSHDAWVKAFFEEGKGTTYSGIWTSDGDILPAIHLREPSQK